MSRRSSVRALAVFGVVIVALSWLPGLAAVPRTWFMTNTFACTASACGPANQMKEGAGNGTFPSGLAVIRDKESRIWIARDAERTGTFGVRTWRLTLGGSAAITRATWTVGTWTWARGGSFTAARGRETVVTSAGSSTFRPTLSFKVPAGSFVAIRVTGAAGNGLANSIDIYDESGGQSPSRLSLS